MLLSFGGHHTEKEQEKRDSNRGEGVQGHSRERPEPPSSNKSSIGRASPAPSTTPAAEPAPTPDRQAESAVSTAQTASSRDPADSSSRSLRPSYMRPSHPAFQTTGAYFWFAFLLLGVVFSMLQCV